MAQYFDVHPDNPQLRLLRQASSLLAQGGILAVPTDSSYALVCHLDDKAAADRLRRIRGVDDRHHLTLLCRDLRELASYARLDQLLTRRFVAEREVPVWILIDNSASLGAGDDPSRKEISPGSKLDVSLSIAAVFACVALAGGDRIHLATLGADGSADRRGGASRRGPLTGRRRLAEVQHYLNRQVPCQGAVNLASALESELRRVRGGLDVLISDFLFESAEISHALDLLVSHRCEAKLVQVLSREDLDPSWLHGIEELIDRETGEIWPLQCDPDTLERYRAALHAHQETLRHLASHRRMALTLQATDASLRTFLQVELPRLGLGLVR